MNKSKIFCAGLHKTATSSLDVALKSVGYRVAGYYGIDNPNISNEALAQALEIMKVCDAAQDDPWYLLYRELDVEFPGSKFILTTRNSQKWYKSAVKHFGNQRNIVREWFYGVGYDNPVGHEEVWIRRKEKHESEVRDYFKDRPKDFLEMDITAGDDWDILGPFLGINKRGGFPKVNTVIDRTDQMIWEKYDKSIGFNRFVYRIALRLFRESTYWLRGSR